MVCRPLMGRPPLLGRMFPSLGTWAANRAVAVRRRLAAAASSLTTSAGSSATAVAGM